MIIAEIRRDISQLFPIALTTLCSLVQSAYDELVDVQDCTTSLFQFAWFGKIFVAATIERAKTRQDRAAQNRVCEIARS